MSLISLFGGFGEFDDWADGIHRGFLERATGDGTVCIVPMTIDDEYLDKQELPYWKKIGVEAEVLPVRSHEEALNIDSANRVLEASLIFLHGGTPPWLMECLLGSLVWSAIVEAVNRGAALEATSGGAKILGTKIPFWNMNSGEEGWLDSFGLAGDLVVAAHWNGEFTDHPEEHRAIYRRLRSFYESNMPKELALVGIEERAAFVEENGVRRAEGGDGRVFVGRGSTSEWFKGGESIRWPAALA